MTRSVVAIGLNAVSNASNVDITEETMMSVLKTGDGPGGIVRALFGDCSLETLERLGAELGMTRRDLDVSYATAKALHAAANDEFDEEGFSLRADDTQSWRADLGRNLVYGNVPVRSPTGPSVSALRSRDR